MPFEELPESEREAMTVAQVKKKKSNDAQHRRRVANPGRTASQNQARSVTLKASRAAAKLESSCAGVIGWQCAGSHSTVTEAGAEANRITCIDLTEDSD